MLTRRYFEIELFHSFHRDGKCTDLRLVPDAATARLMKNHRMILRPLANGIAVAAEVNVDHSLFIEPAANAVFRFRIEVVDYDFTQYSEVPLLAPLTQEEQEAGSIKIHAFSNQNLSAGETLLPHIDKALEADLKPAYNRAWGMVELHLNDSLGTVLSEPVGFRIVIQNKSETWRYYLLTEPTSSDFTIEDGLNEVQFTKTNLTDDSGGAVLENGYWYRGLPLPGEVWEGPAEQPIDFAINGERLQSNGPEADDQHLFLSTANTAVDDVEWQFTIDLDFIPTDTHQARIWLMADRQNVLDPATKGYCMRFGQTGADRIRLVQVDGQGNGTDVENTLTASGTDPGGVSTFTGYINVRLRVRRNATGQWDFWVAEPDGSNEVHDFSGVDATHSAGTHFGLECLYALASRYNAFGFENFQIGTTTKPVVQGSDPVWNRLAPRYPDAAAFRFDSSQPMPYTELGRKGLTLKKDGSPVLSHLPVPAIKDKGVKIVKTFL